MKGRKKGETIKALTIVDEKEKKKQENVGNG